MLMGLQQSLFRQVPCTLIVQLLAHESVVVGKVHVNPVCAKTPIVPKHTIKTVNNTLMRNPNFLFKYKHYTG